MDIFYLLFVDSFFDRVQLKHGRCKSNHLNSSKCNLFSRTIFQFSDSTRRASAQEAYFQKIHLPWSRLGSAPRHAKRATLRVDAQPCSQTIRPWIETQANGSHPEVAQGKEGSSTTREASNRQDPSSRHDHCPRNGRIHCWYLQRQNLQPGTKN
jgi:hypothetical protein